VNINNLTPAPWHAGMPCADLCDCFRGTLGGQCSNVWANEGREVTKPCAGLGKDDAEFIALARNAFDVMLRRGWWAVPCSGDVWKVETVTDRDDEILAGKYWPDPYTALVEADKLFPEAQEAP
jgi:hypothetical protein